MTEEVTLLLLRAKIPRRLEEFENLCTFLSERFSSVFPGNFRNSLSEPNKQSVEEKGRRGRFFMKPHRNGAHNILPIKQQTTQIGMRRQAFQRGELLKTFPAFYCPETNPSTPFKASFKL